MLKTFFAGAVAISALTNHALHAENWPEFRGPTGQGISTARHLPVEWSETNNVAWKQAIPGKGWSSPVLFERRLYLTSAVSSPDNSSLSLSAVCLDADSGRILWNTDVFSGSTGKDVQMHNKNSRASATPLIEGHHLYVHFGPEGTACLDLSGKVLWRNSSLKYSPVHGNGGSPIVVEDALIFSCDGASAPFVVALNKTNGEVLWKVKRDTDATKTFSFSTPLLITVNGQKQVLSPGSNVLCSFDPKTGREIWRVRYDGYSVVPRPVFGQGLIFFSIGFDNPVVMAVRPDGRGDVTDRHVAWTVRRGAPNTPSLLLVGGELYMLSDAGIASCLDAKTGQVHWQERIGGNCSASPIYGDGRIYFQNEEGLGVVIKAGREFEKLASNPLHERTLASYAVGEGSLFIRTERQLYRIQVRQ